MEPAVSVRRAATSEGEALVYKDALAPVDDTRFIHSYVVAPTASLSSAFSSQLLTVPSPKMSAAALRLTLLAILLVVHSVKPMSINKVSLSILTSLKSTRNSN